MVEILKLYDSYTEQLLALAGNSKSFDYPCQNVPKAIDNLIQSEPYSGHDLVTGLLPVLVNCELSKPERCLLLFNYGKYMNVSSQSLMHRNLANLPLEEVDTSFSYGFSFVANVRLFKRMLMDFPITGQENNKGLDDLLTSISEFLRSHFDININHVENDSFNYFKHDGVSFQINSRKVNKNAWYIRFNGFDLSFIEQLLRYSSGTVWTGLGKNLFRKGKITDTQYGVEGVFTLKQIQVIISQRINHKLPQWQLVCEKLKELV